MTGTRGPGAFAEYREPLAQPHPLIGPTVDHEELGRGDYRSAVGTKTGTVAESMAVPGSA